MSSQYSLAFRTPAHLPVWLHAPFHIMDSNSRADESSETSVRDESSDRPPGEPVRSTTAAPDDTVEPSPARQPQNRVFTFFKHLPAELRLLIWEFACARHGPRIHFLEPIDVSDKTLQFFVRSSERLDPEIHWEVSEGTRDPCFQWSGRDVRLHRGEKSPLEPTDHEPRFKQRAASSRISSTYYGPDLCPCRICNSWILRVFEEPWFSFQRKRYWILPSKCASVTASTCLGDTSSRGVSLEVPSV